MGAGAVMSMQRLLSGRYALITGATRGLGALIAQAYWREGAHIAIVGRSAERLEQLKSTLTPSTSGQIFLPIVADLAEENSPDIVAKAVEQAFGRLSILVNNAAVQGPIGPVCQNSWNEWQQTIRVNLLVPVQLCCLFCGRTKAKEELSTFPAEAQPEQDHCFRLMPRRKPGWFGLARHWQRRKRHGG